MDLSTPPPVVKFQQPSPEARSIRAFLLRRAGIPVDDLVPFLPSMTRCSFIYVPGILSRTEPSQQLLTLLLLHSLPSQADNPIPPASSSPQTWRYSIFPWRSHTASWRGQGPRHKRWTPSPLRCASNLTRPRFPLLLNPSALPCPLPRSGLTYDGSCACEDGG